MIKVMIAFPSLPESKGIPQLTQNRQFQWYHSPSTFIYPIIPATAATLLKDNDFQVDFYDGIAQRQTFHDFLQHYRTFQPELTVFETKTPIIKQHWRIINQLHAEVPDSHFVLMGDHVTALPQESLVNSAVDYVISGGDFDVILLDLAQHLRDGSALPKGIWYRQHGAVKSSGEAQLSTNLDTLPWIDRELTKWQLYKEAYLLRPVTYLMSGRDCPYRCTFCSWSNILFPKMRYRSVKNVLDEVEVLRDKYRIKEIFDDTGTFTVSKKWVEEFCREMQERGLNDEIYYSINSRFDHFQDYDYCKMLKKSGFRIIKVGLESGNNTTLQRIRKRLTTQQIYRGAKSASNAGLTVFLTIMVGYPWESQEDAEKTVSLARELMIKGWASILQGSVIIPYPGTPLYQEALTNNWFTVNPEAWELFDMTHPVLQTSMNPATVMKMCDDLWRIYLHPQYLLRRLIKIRGLDDLRFTLNGLSSVIGHIRDFMR
jgi:radical SAM superfamily enzyme YgiQ (UPF0313 family)